jgi:hypothetical protein
VLSAPIFLECRSAPAPCQKKECHSHFAPFNKKEWHSSLALSKKSALFLSLFFKERKIYLTENFLAMLEFGNLREITCQESIN